MVIYIDTREKNALDFGNIGIKHKLDEGDYSTPLLESSLVIERKSPGDLYGSILKGHKRFKREIERAKNKNKEFHIFVECNKDEFISMRWNHQKCLMGNPRQLAAIIKTMTERHNIIFHWCENRDIMRNEIIDLFITKESELLNKTKIEVKE